MALGWKRGRLLLILLFFLNHAVGHKDWISQNVPLKQNWPVHKHFLSRGDQSSVLVAPVNGSSPVEVVPNVSAGKNLNASRSRFSLLHQFAKGGFSSSYGSMSNTQNVPSVSDRLPSLLQLQGSSSPSAQNIVNQSASGQVSYSRYALSSQHGSGLQGVSAQRASTSVGSGSSSGLSIQSQSSSSLLTPDSLSKLSFQSPDVSSQPTGDQSPSNLFTGSSQNSSGLQLGGASSQVSTTESSSTTGTSASSLSQFTSTSRGISGPQLAEGSSLLVSTEGVNGLFVQSSSTESQNTPGASLYAKLASSPLGVSHSASGQNSYSQYTSKSQSSAGAQLAASHQYVPGQGSSYGLSVQSRGTTSQYAPALSWGAKLPVSSQYYQATPSASVSQSQSSPRWQPSTSRIEGFQASSTAVSQSSSWPPSRFSSLSSAGGSISSINGSSMQAEGTSSQNAPSPLDSKVPVYSQAASSGPSSSLSRPSQWQPSSRWLQVKTSGSVASQSSSQSQGSKAPSIFSTLTSAASPGQFASTQEVSGRYSGLSNLSQGSLSLYSLESPAYAQYGSSLLDVSSQSASGQGSYGQYTSGSQSRAGTQLAGSSPSVPVQTVSTSTDSSSLQLQGMSSQYAHAALNAKVPVYRQAASSGSSLSLSQPPQWQPSASRSQSFQTSGTVASQSSFPSQGFKAPLLSSTSAASPGQFASTQEGSGRYSGLSSLSQGTSSQYSPGYSGYVKLAASPLGASQSTSGQSPYSQYTSSSQSRTGTPLAGSVHYAPVQAGSTFTDGSPLQLQGTSSQYAHSPLDAKVPVYSQAAPTAPSLSPSQPSQWHPSSRWLQVKTSGSVASQSSSQSQGSNVPSSFSSLTSAASPGQSVATQEGSGRYSGLSSLSQGTSSQYSRGSPAYAKRGPNNVSSQSKSDQSSSGLYTSSSQSMAGTQLAGSSHSVPAQTGSTFTGASFQFQGTSNQYAPLSWQYTQASPSGSSLTGSEASRKWQPSASAWSQAFQASGTAVPQSSSSPQSSQTSSGSVFLSALSPSVAQSSLSSSRRTSSFFGVGLGPSKLSTQAASGSTISSQISPGPSASVRYPSDSMTSSLGSSVQGGSQAIFSGQSSDSTSIISSSYGSTYGQKASGYSRPSQGSSATGRYFSSVKG